MSPRTDRNNNPTAFTTAIAQQGGLILGTDYEVGDPFRTLGDVEYTAKLLGDPIELTIKVIDKIGFRTHDNRGRWVYINMPKFVWDGLLDEEKKLVIQDMYHFEGGTELEHLFA